MSTNTSPQLQGWRYGVHPQAAGLRVRSLNRVELPLGEAMRLELGSDAPDDSDERHLQYYVMTEAGPWALWLSCASADLPFLDNLTVTRTAPAWAAVARPVPSTAGLRALAAAAAAAVAVGRRAPSSA